MMGAAVPPKYGVCDENLWQYDESKWRTKPSDYCYTMAKRARTPRCTRVHNDLDSLLKALHNYRPIVFGMLLFDDFMRVGADGRVPMPGANARRRGGHAMLIVGYNQADRHFVVRNSWGPRWGDRGHCYVPLDYLASYAWDFWTVDSIDGICGRAQCTVSGPRVAVFEHCNLLGATMELPAGTYALGNLLLPDNSISSLVVPVGLQVQLFDAPNLSGESLTLNAGTYNCLTGPTAPGGGRWNDRISSLVVRRV